MTVYKYYNIFTLTRVSHNQEKTVSEAYEKTPV